MRPRLLSVLILVLLGAGCVGLGAPEAPALEPQEAAAPTPDESGSIAYAAPVPERAAKAMLPVAFEERWLKPLQPARGNLSVSAEANATWFAGLRDERMRLVLVAEHPYLAFARDAPRWPNTGEVLPGTAPAAIRFHELGRHLVHDKLHPDATVNVTILPGTVGGAAHTFLVRDAQGVRYSPDEILLPPGSAVVFHNLLDEPMDAQQTGHLLLLPRDGTSVHFTPVDEGLYDVVGLVRGDPRGPAFAHGTLLVDFDRPATQDALGPFTGNFPTGEAGEARSHAFEAQHPLRELVLEARAASLVPMPAMVRLVLDGPGGRLAEWSSDAETPLVLRNLPPGPYAVRVEPQAGALTEYRIGGKMTYALPLPDALRDEP